MATWAVILFGALGCESSAVEAPAAEGPPSLLRAGTGPDYARLAKLYRGFPSTAELWRGSGLHGVAVSDSAFVTITERLTRAFLTDPGADGSLRERGDYLSRQGCIDLGACSYFEFPNSTVFRADDTSGSVGPARRLVCANNQPNEEGCDNFLYFAVPAARVRGYVSTSPALDAALELQTGSGALSLSSIDDSTCAVVLGSRTIFGLALNGEAAPGAALERNFRVVLE